MKAEVLGKKNSGDSTANLGAGGPSPSVAPDVNDENEPWVACVLFFSTVAEKRMLLPNSCFNSMNLGFRNVTVLDRPRERFANAAHKSLWSWLTNDLRIAVATGKELTLSLVVKHGADVLEAFQMHIRESQLTEKPEAIENFDVRITHVLWRLKVLFQTLDVKREYANFLLDISPGRVAFRDEDEELFEEFPNVSSDVPSLCLRKMDTKVLGFVRFLKIEVECIGYLPS